MNDVRTPQKPDDVQPLRIVVSNVFNDDNRGGAAITAATIRILHEAFPHAVLSLITTTGDAAQLNRTHRHTIAQFPEVELLPALVRVRAKGGAVTACATSLVLWWSGLGMGARGPTGRGLRDARLVVGKGGQLFKGSRRGPALLGFWLAVLPLVIAHRRRVPTALYSVTIGPYADRRNGAARLASWVLRRIDLVLVRDEHSRDEALKLGVPAENVVQIVDSVLTSPAPTEDDLRLSPQLARVRTVPFGAVTMTSWRGLPDEELFEVLGAATRAALANGVVERIVVVLQTDGPTTSDRRVSEAFVRWLGEPQVELFDEDLPPADLMALYGAARFTLACRLHSALFSLVAGTPTIAVSRSTTVKADDIFRTLGLEHYVVRIDDDGTRREQATAHLTRLLTQMTEDGSGARQEIASAVQRLRPSHDRAVEALRRLL